MIAVRDVDIAVDGRFPCRFRVGQVVRLRRPRATNRILQRCEVKEFFVSYWRQDLRGNMNLKGNRLTWLGHATFRIETAEGKSIYVDPWVMGNPLCPQRRERSEEGRRTHLHARALRPHRRRGEDRQAAQVAQWSASSSCACGRRRRVWSDFAHEQGRHADGGRREDHHDARCPLVRHHGRRRQHCLWRRGVRLRAGVARRREAVSRRRHGACSATWRSSASCMRRRL